MRSRKVWALLPLLAIAIVAGSASIGRAASSRSVLNFAYPYTFDHLDPSIAFAVENDILSQIYETLTIYNMRTGKLEPNLATSWSHNKSGRIWTFHLRHRVKFQNGAPFNSAAVKFSLERTKKINQGAAYLWKPVKSIRTAGPYTVKITLSQKQPLPLMLSSGWGAYMMTPTADNHASSWFQAGRGVGTGPYKWKSYSPNQSAVLTKFAGYWRGWKSGQFSTINFEITPDAATRSEDIISGQAQLTEGLAPHDVASLRSSKGVAIHPVNVLAYQYLLLNTAEPPTNNLKVREAVAYAFPLKQVVNSVYAGYGAVSEGDALVPNGLWGYKPHLKPYTYNLARARALLAQAGYPKGGLTMSLIYNANDPEPPAIGELWKASLAKIGVTLNLEGLSGQAYQQTDEAPAKKRGNAEIRHWTPTYPSPQDYLLNMFTPEGIDWVAWSNRKVTKLVNRAQAQSGSSLPKAARTFGNAEAIILRNAVAIPMVERPYVYAASSSIHGSFVNRNMTLFLYGLRG